MIADEHATESGLLEGLTFLDLDSMVARPEAIESMASAGMVKRKQLRVCSLLIMRNTTDQLLNQERENKSEKQRPESVRLKADKKRTASGLDRE